jgi:hypothetical protein
MSSFFSLRNFPLHMNFGQICLCLLLSELSGTNQYPYLGVGECYTKNQLKTELNFGVILHIRLLFQISNFKSISYQCFLFSF